MSKEFKVGDRVELVEGYSCLQPGAVGVVTSAEPASIESYGQYLQVDFEGRPCVGIFSIRVKHVVYNPFVKGDKVRLKNQKQAQGRWTGTMVYDGAYEGRCEHPTMGFGGFALGALEFVEEPRDFRVIFEGVVGNIVYQSREAAEAAARQHGKDGQQFTIVEIVHIVTYKVNVETTLEAV